VRRGARGLLLSCAALAAASCGPAAEPAADTGRADPGGAGITATSDDAAPPAPRPERVSARFQVEFGGGAPEQELAVVHHGPVLARWMMSAPPSPAFPSGARILEYRFGGRAFHVPAGSASSLELLGEDLAVELRRMELRGALLPWDASAWTIDGSGAARQILAQPAGSADTSGAVSLGELRASLDADGRPRSIGACAPDGSEQERLVVAGWRVEAGWSWPERAELWVGDQRIWSERLIELSTRARYLDVFFAPPDRAAELCPPADGLPGAPRPVLLPAVLELVSALDAGADLAAARTRAGELRAELAPELARWSLALDPSERFELGGDLRPVAVVLRLASEPAGAPPGWSRTAEATGWQLELEPGAAPGRADLERLRAAFGATDPSSIRLEDALPRGRLIVR
jgi:hypothetical protein